MQIEDFFDLRVATVEPDETPPPSAHLVRIEEPRDPIEGWFYKPCYVTYILSVPASLDAYIDEYFPSPIRSKPRKLLRDVPKRYRLVADERNTHLPKLVNLYRRTIVSRPRGRDRLAEDDDLFDRRWLAYYLFDGDALVAGILVHRMRDHLSVAYGAFDPAHRKMDIEHYLLMQALQQCIDVGLPYFALGMDTNRYGHHLSLGLPAYKMRLGFTPIPFEPAGRELLKIQDWSLFKNGLFFYAFEDDRFVGRLFAPESLDRRPLQQRTAPPIIVEPLPASPA